MFQFNFDVVEQETPEENSSSQNNSDFKIEFDTKNQEEINKITTLDQNTSSQKNSNFRFDFDIEYQESSQAQKDPNVASISSPPPAPMQIVQVSEGISKLLLKNVTVKEYHAANASNNKVFYYDEKELDSWIKTTSSSSEASCPVSKEIVTALENHVDVIPGCLEGGFTLWRGSCDLVDFLSDATGPVVAKIPGAKVLEAGCGAGLPGLLALRAGAREVHFQDYNKDVLVTWTIPNAYLNLPTNPNCSLQFISGDWVSMADHVEQIALNGTTNPFYDIILTAETIYREENYAKLHRLMETCLALKGEVFLAAKTKYYGVGGDLNDFLDFVVDQNVFVASRKDLIGQGVVRSIVTLSRR